MIISIINQKGGVAKTTTTFNLAGNLASLGYKVLQIDIDPQGSLTIANGIEPQTLEKSMYDVLLNEMDMKEILIELEENLSLAPSNLDLSVGEISIVNIMARETILKRSLRRIKEGYDYILIDCPPNLGLLTINALTASDKVLIPVSTDYLALRGLELLVETIEKVKNNLNENLEILGIVATMHDLRTRHSGEILEVLKNNDYDLLGIINISTEVKDSILASIPLAKYNPNHKVSAQYKEVTDNLIKLTRQ